MFDVYRTAAEPFASASLSDDLPLITQLLKSHEWVPLTLIVMLWLYRALANDSKFPINWPAGWAKWKPAFVIVLGQAICVLKSISYDHTRWYIAIWHGLIISLVALGAIHVLRNIWPNDGDEPKWLRVLVLVFDKVAPILVTTAVAEEKKPDDEPPNAA